MYFIISLFARTVKVHLSLCYWNQSQHFPAKLWQRENLLTSQSQSIHSDCHVYLSSMHSLSFVCLVEGNLEIISKQSSCQASLLYLSIDAPRLRKGCARQKTFVWSGDATKMMYSDKEGMSWECAPTFRRCHFYEFPLTFSVLQYLILGPYKNLDFWANSVHR